MTDLLILELYQAFENNRQRFIDAGLPPVATIDRWRGQTVDPAGFEYYPLPAIFLGRSTNWSREGMNWNGAVTFDFHVETETTGEMASLAVGKEDALKYYRLINMIRSVLDNFKSERISALERSTDREMDTGVTIYEILSYSTIYYETDKQISDYQDEIPEEMEEDDEYPTGLVRTIN